LFSLNLFSLNLLSLDIKTYKTGTTNKVKNVPINIPDTKTIPILFLALAPAPLARISGKCPTTVAKLVISIGLNLLIDALVMASSLDKPCSFKTFANSTIRIPFFATKPTNVTKPTCGAK